MIQRLSIHTLVAGFTMGGILLCLTMGFVIALAFPSPPPRMVSVAQAQVALTAPSPGVGWTRRISAEPPFPAIRTGQGRLVQSGLTVLLDADPADVRVRSLSQERAPASGRLNLNPEGSLSLGGKAFAAGLALAPGTTFAPFEAAVRQQDGRWLVVTPRLPLLTPQRLRMALAFLIVAAVLLPLALWGAGRLTAPFRRLSEAARGPPDRSAEAFVGGPREAADAARALDSMRDRLGEALRDRTTIMAAIAHDLRTPLTGLRLRVERLPLQSRGAAVADIARMERLIAQLLTYVRGEDAPWNAEPLDIADLTEDCVERQIALGRPVTLHVQGEHLVLGDRDQLDRALGNLIDNAVLYGDQAVVTVLSEDRWVWCTIDDAGPGLPPDQMEAVFSPFHRVETSRSRTTGGAGLGLAISRSIVQRNGGSVVLKNRCGGGLRVEVRFPRLDRRS